MGAPSSCSKRFVLRWTEPCAHSTACRGHRASPARGHLLPRPVATSPSWPGRATWAMQRGSLPFPAPSMAPSSASPAQELMWAWLRWLRMEKSFCRSLVALPRGQRGSGRVPRSLCRQSTASRVGCGAQSPRARTSSAGTHGAQRARPQGHCPGHRRAQRAPGTSGQRGKGRLKENQESTLQCKTAFIAGGGQQGLGRTAEPWPRV